MTSAAVPAPPGILRDETDQTFDAPWQAQGHCHINAFYCAILTRQQPSSSMISIT
jgi:hypothetical protein